MIVPIVAKILLVEDDADLSTQLCDWLKMEKHTVESTADGNDAFERLRFYKYELIILDRNLPGLDGIEVLRRFRDQGGDTPVLILTGQKEIRDKEVGLDTGADDYLTKPFDFKELSARVRALLRRAGKVTQATISADYVVLESANHRVTIDGNEVQLLPKEFALLEFLMHHPNEVFSQEALLDRVWNSESDASINTVYTYVKTLRKKINIEGHPSIIKTVHGLGYKLELPDKRK